MYGNVLLFHDSINSDSVLKDKFIDNNVDFVSILKKMRSIIESSFGNISNKYWYKCC